MRTRLIVLGLTVGLVGAVQVTAGAAPTCTIVGSASGELLVGTAGRDVICGRGGNDWIEPRGGNDLVLAGPGDDYVHGSPGADVIKGGLGRDHLMGGIGPDKLFGGDGADRCLSTRDTVSGNDSASGGPGVDVGYRNPGDTFIGIEREQDPPLVVCPPTPPRPSF